MRAKPKVCANEIPTRNPVNGPGPGALTKLLVQKAKSVVAVEFDEMLASKLVNNLNSPANLKVINQDILKFNLNDLPQNYIVVANIPYYLTSKLLRNLCESTNPPNSVVLLIQKEVAQRLASEPGQMSLLSVSTQVYYSVSLGSLVPAKMFLPPPKVDSQVATLSRLKAPLISDEIKEQFFLVVKAGFSERRKKLRSSLSGGLRISKMQADDLINNAGLSPDSRAQELSITQWITLTNTINLKNML